MKKTRTKLLILVATLIFTMMISIVNTAVFAINTDLVEGQNNVSSENGINPISADTEVDVLEDGTIIQEDNNDIQIYEDDLYVIYGESDTEGSVYKMDKYVSGNVFIIAPKVEIAGEIDGSLFVLAGEVVIDENAYVGVHGFICAENIKISGYIADVYAAGNSFELTKSGVVYRDLRVAANNVKLTGGVGRNIKLAASDIQVYEDDENKLECMGSLSYTSPKEIENLDKVQISGDVKFTQEEVKEEGEENIVYDYIYDIITNVIFTIAIYALAIFLAPKFVEKSKEYVSTKALLTFAIGIAFVILVPLLAIILLFTGITWTLSIFAILVYVPVLMLNSAAVAITIDEFLASKVSALNETWKKVLMIIPITVVLDLVRKIPVAGGIISAIILFVGIGIIVLYQFDKRKKKEEVAEEN